jgi:hypothetical protein
MLSVLVNILVWNHNKTKNVWVAEITKQVNRWCYERPNFIHPDPQKTYGTYIHYCLLERKLNFSRQVYPLSDIHANLCGFILTKILPG